MAASAPLRLGISQRHGGALVPEGARAFAAALADRMNHAVHVQITKDYASLLRAAVASAVELAWMPPFLYMAAATRDLAKRLVLCERNGALTYRSAVLIRASSDWREISDLAHGNLRLAWSDPSSAAGHIFPRMHLIHSGLDPQRDFAAERFHGSPLAACAAVAEGEADVCSCFVHQHPASDPARVLADVSRVFPAAPWRLRVLAVTQPIPADGILLSEQLSAELQTRLTSALLALHTHPDGREALSKLMIADRLMPVTDELAKVVEKTRAWMPAPA